jgi:hypothetical protein
MRLIVLRYAHSPRPAPAVGAQYEGEGAFQRGSTMQPKWIALGLFVAGLCLIIAGGLPQLKHIAAGLAAVLA